MEGGCHKATFYKIEGAGALPGSTEAAFHRAGLPGTRSIHAEGSHLSKRFPKRLRIGRDSGCSAIGSWPNPITDLMYNLR